MSDSAATLNLLKQFSVLYVEDDSSVRESLLRFLKRRFKDVFTAKDGKEGFEIFEIENPDIVITDIQMPVMDGLEMSRMIKEKSPGTPVLITTAFNESPFLKKAEELGIEKYIKKPVIKEDILGSLADCAEKLAARRG